MGSNQDDRFAFIVEWFDQQASLVRRYELLYYPSDCSVEMYDVKNRRMFLRRTKTEAISQRDLYIGNVLTLYARQLTVVEYGDEFTRKTLGHQKERTVGFIKPDGMSKLGAILDIIIQHGYHISRMRTTQFEKSDVSHLYNDLDSQPSYFQLLEFLSSKPVLIFELVGDQAISKFRELVGPSDPAKAKSDSPLSLRARFGTDTLHNVIHAAENSSAVMRESEFFFPSTGKPRANTAKFCDSTLCLIKPSAVASGCTGKILEAINDCNFELSAITMFTLNQANAEEFLEVYKGVVNEYVDMVAELISGPCVAIEVRAQEAATAFREFAGPFDPEIAKALRPRTLRAQFGKNKIQNAIHCTDLPEDAPLEVEYFFKILDR